MKRCLACGRLVADAVTVTMKPAEEEGVEPRMIIVMTLCPACARRFAELLLELAEEVEEGEAACAGERVVGW